MKLWTSLFLILLLCSCKDFDLKKQSAEQIMEEEMKSINWKEVDFYPTFQNCGSVTSKSKSKTCFETEIKNNIGNHLSQYQLKTSNSIRDTVVLKLHISAEGDTKIKDLKISDHIASQNPELETWLKEAISQLPEVYPAQKRSVPVPLHTELPIILK
ncbi:hypothetical protein [Psychroflexus montanilacus]|uniref:hypothetical protein n=1 Tax=Psychroflexus montanilacus TaxID=2873598 RepID=UPI001CC95147|nr:hypothetical protein [Psychroflexus montanilacus]MBZ9651404.1 hypothetical protein [Psychroflexus montanilacus]